MDEHPILRSSSHQPPFISIIVLLLLQLHPSTQKIYRSYRLTFTVFPLFPQSFHKCRERIYNLYIVHKEPWIPIMLCLICHWTSHWALPPPTFFVQGQEGRTVAQVRNVTWTSEEWGAAAWGGLCRVRLGLTVKGVCWGREAPPSSVRPKVLICGPRPWRQGVLSCRQQSRYSSSLDRETDRERRCQSPSHRGAAGNLSDRHVPVGSNLTPGWK